jgi:nitrate/nitrite sensing protein
VTYPEVRARAWTIALVPSAALAVIGLALGGFLVHHGHQAQEFADRAASATASVTDLVTTVRQERRRIDIGHPRVDSSRDKIVDNAIAGLQRSAQEAPDAQVGYQQLVAAQLLTAVDGLSRTDALAAGGTGFNPDQLSAFVAAFGSYHANLTAAAGKLTDRGRELYSTLVQSDAWYRLGVAERALVAGDRSPMDEGEWRASARHVADGLEALSAQQSAYATQLAEESGRRTFAGALASTAAILILSAVACFLAIRLARRLGADAAANAVVFVSEPHHQASQPTLRVTDIRLMEAVLAGIRNR